MNSNTTNAKFPISLKYKNLTVHTSEDFLLRDPSSLMLLETAMKTNELFFCMYGYLILSSPPPSPSLPLLPHLIYPFPFYLTFPSPNLILSPLSPLQPPSYSPLSPLIFHLSFYSSCHPLFLFPPPLSI